MPVVGKENKNWKKRNCVECQFESGHSLECSKYKEHDCQADELDLMLSLKDCPRKCCK